MEKPPLPKRRTLLGEDSMKITAKGIVVQTAVICSLFVFFFPPCKNKCEENVYDRCLFAKHFSASYVKFDKTKSLTKKELREFEQLCGSGSFGKNSLSMVSDVNGMKFETYLPLKQGWIRRSWHPLPKSMLYSYNPFDEVLYVSDDWEDDYLHGLIVSNVPNRLVRYQEWDKQYPEWMDSDVSALKQRMTGSFVPVRIRAFTRPPYGISIAYRYFVPYMHSAFGASVKLLSDEVVYNGKQQHVVDIIDMTRKPDEIDITIGDTTIQTDRKK